MIFIIFALPLLYQFFIIILTFYIKFLYQFFTLIFYINLVKHLRFFQTFDIFPNI